MLLIAKTKENLSGNFVQATDSVTVWAEGKRILDELNPSLRQFLKMDSDDNVKWFLPNMIKGISLTLPKLKVGEEAHYSFFIWNGDIAIADCVSMMGLMLSRLILLYCLK